MALAKGSKAVLTMLGVAYLIFLAVFFYQATINQGLVSVPVFETKNLQLAIGAEDMKSLEEFAKKHVKIDVLNEAGRTGRYKVVELRASILKKMIEKGEKNFLGADASQAAAALGFEKKRYITAAQVKAEDGKIVLDKKVPLGLIQVELLTRYGISGKTQIPVQGHGPIIGINATMGFVILNFLILVALLYGLLWEPITNMLDERSASIRKDIEQASASREDAEKLKSRYEQALANARSEANRMRQEKVREGDAEKDIIISNAREEARRLADDAKSQVEAAVIEAKHELRKEISDISVEIAGRILAKEVDKEVHRKMMDDFLRNLETEQV